MTGTEPPFRILSLDGGGTWALIEAMALAALYPGKSGHEVLAQFDMAAGNSGGAIVIAALLADMAPAAIVSMFRDQDQRARLYVPVRGVHALLARTGVSARWSSAGKLAGIKATLGATGALPLDGLGVSTRILIPSYEVDTGRSVVYRSHSSRLGASQPVPLALAAHASSAAPVTYFDAPADVMGARMWDGGIGGYNNPVMLAVAEAMALGHRDVWALSIGTAKSWRPLGHLMAPLAALRAKLDLLGSIRLLSTAVIGDPPGAAAVHAFAATGGQVVRLSPSIQPVLGAAGWTLPDGFRAIRPSDPFGAFSDLIAYDMDVSEQAQVETIAGLAAAWIGDAIPNEPLIMDPDTGRATLGACTWSDGVAAWKCV